MRRVRRISRKSVAGKASLAVAGVLVGLLLAELGARVSEKLGGADVAIVREPDAQLGFRVRGGSPGHDADGFRNDAVPARADVVAIGDSQTWGYNAGREEAWPQKLAELSGRSVYNMGVGGYGPAQYHALTKKALGIRPKVLVVGLYFGNDFYDSYATVYGNEAYAHLRGGAAARDLSPDTIAQRIKSLDDEKQAFDARFAPRGPSLWLRQHTALGRLLHRAVLLPGEERRWFEVNKAWAEAHPSHGAAYDDGRTRTIFNTAYRLLALDMDDPRIVEGLRLSCEFLSLIKAEADAAGVGLLVVFIPTKETVYADALRSAGANLDGNHSRLVEMEESARAEVNSFCVGAGIEHVDAGPALREAVKAGRQIYPTTLDGHPNAQAYQLIAATVNESLSKPSR